MTPEEVYISPQGKVLAINTKNLTDQNSVIVHCLEEGKWYEVDLPSKNISIRDPHKYIWIKNKITLSIPYNPNIFMSKLEWRDKELKKLGI